MPETLPRIRLNPGDEVVERIPNEFIGGEEPTNKEAEVGVKESIGEEIGGKKRVIDEEVSGESE